MREFDVESVAKGLLPCPFCGGKAWLSSIQAEPQYIARAQCEHCEAQLFASDLGAAFAAWNTRRAYLLEQSK